MKKRFFSLCGIAFGVLLALPAMTNAFSKESQSAKASSEFGISKVALQNIAGGYGNGISLECTGLNLGYWNQASDVSGIKLLNPYGKETDMVIEEVGSQLCINRNGKIGLGYTDYVIEFNDFTLTFGGTTYTCPGTSKFFCDTAQPYAGYYWTSVPSGELTVGENSISLAAGSTSQISPAFSGKEDARFYYESEDTDIVTVDANGLVTGVDSGDATINVYSCGQKAEISVTVTDNATLFTIDKVALQNIAGGWGDGISLECSNLSTSYWQGVNYSGNLKLFDRKGQEVPVVVEEVGSQLCINRNGTLGINYSGYVLQIDEGLRFTASNGTSYKLSLSVKYICETLQPAYGYYWQQFYDANISVEPTAETSVGLTTTLTPSVEGHPNASFAYTSDNEGVATVSDTGVVTGVAVGTANITIHSALKTATVAVTVNEPQAQQTGIKVKTEEVTVQQYGQLKLSDIVVVSMFDDVEGSRIEVTEDMLDGELDLDVPGEYELTVTSGEFTDSFTVKVIAIPEVTFGTYFGNDSPWGTAFYFTFSNDQNNTINVFLDDQALANAKEHIKVNGSTGAVQNILNTGANRYELWFNEGVIFKTGDTIEIEAGLQVWYFDGPVDGGSLRKSGDGSWASLGIVKEGFAYVFNGTGWAHYVGEPTEINCELAEYVSVGSTAQINYTVGPDGTFGIPSFSSEDSTIASVDASGLVTGVAEGSTTIHAILGELNISLPITVLPAKDIVGVKFVGIPNYFSIVKGTNIDDFNPQLLSAQLIFEDDSLSPVIALDEDSVVRVGDIDTSVAMNEPEAVEYKVAINDELYSGYIQVQVYELYPQECKEVGIVDWFAYSVFLQYENTCSNVANIQDSTLMSNLASKISYTRADGTPVSFGVWQLGANVCMLMNFGEGVTLNADNYNDYYLVGDTITIQKDMPLFRWTGDIFDNGSDNHAMVAGTGEFIVDGYTKEEVTYRYDGQIWGIYIPYEDLAIAKDSLTLNVGETATAGATRVPGNATSGVFTYTSSNEEVAKVSASGIISAVGVGTCTITVKLAESDGSNVKTGTITVTVKDPVTGLKISGSVSAVQGTELDKLDLSGLTVKALFASGAEGDVIDLSKVTYEISGYDKDKLGDQKVVLTISLDGGSPLSGTFTITVKAPEAKGGCGGSILATSGLITLVAGLGVCLISLKKRKEF